ncbi:HTH_Tnp_Tc3_2 domain-containing protein [Trichonephila clavipes]|nr:HTH_Tnp_Tc3_2 domain-containing protein [Trichonephila clavipes]
MFGAIHHTYGSGLLFSREKSPVDLVLDRPYSPNNSSTPHSSKNLLSSLLKCQSDVDLVEPISRFSVLQVKTPIVEQREGEGNVRSKSVSKIMELHYPEACRTRSAYGFDETLDICYMGHEKKVPIIKNSSNFDHQKEIWCPNDVLESLKWIQLHNMLNIFSIDLNNVLKTHDRVFNGSAKQLTRDFSHVTFTASFQIRSLNDDIHAEQLSGCCRSEKTVLPEKLDLFLFHAGSQRPPITNSREDRHVTRKDLLDCAATSQALSQELGSFARQQVSARTVRRRLLQHGLSARRLPLRLPHT